MRKATRRQRQSIEKRPSEILMFTAYLFTAYLAVTLLAAAANVFSAGADFVRYPQVAIVLFFVGAIITHVRGHFYAFTLPISFLTLALAALTLRLATA